MFNNFHFFKTLITPSTGGCLQQEKLALQKTDKIHLKLLECLHSYDSLSATAHDIGKNRPIFFYSNDAGYFPSYLNTCYSYAYTSTNNSACFPSHFSDITFKDFYTGGLTTPNNLLGVVIGNGYILSVLPDIRANDILLLDKEPVVHYFIMSVRKLILEANLDDTFEIIKEALIAKIILIENSIKKQATVIDNQISILDEMKMLGEKHFLANKSRFIQCRAALQVKDILPIEIDVLDIELMAMLSETILLSKCEVSFLNLTNVADYDKEKNLYSCIAQLPLSENVVIVTTQLLSDKQKRKCYVSTNLPEFLESLKPVQEKESDYRLLINNIAGFLPAIFNQS